LDIADQIKQTFIDETEELLGDLEGMLLDLETDPENSGYLDAVFRLMHTIKGSSGMVGEDRIYKFAHMVEDVFDTIRKGKLQFNSEIANMALESRDIILSLIREYTPEIEIKISNVADKIKKLSGEEQILQKADDTENDTKKQAKSKNLKNYRIKFLPDRGIFKRGGNPLLIMNELSAIGTVTIKVIDSSIPELSNISSDICYTGWEIFLTTSLGMNDVKDVFLFVESESLVEITDIGHYSGEEDEIAKVGEILIDRGVIDPKALKSEIDNRKKIGEVLVEKHIVSETELESALTEQEHLKKVQQKTFSGQSIRISTERVDAFVDLIGELVTLQAQFNQYALDSGNYELTNITEALQRLTEELRDSVLGIRMIPLGQSFGLFRRLVRDLSTELGKKIQFMTEGEETELDKTVIDKMKEPLVHIIRNSIDHGIETPDVRKANGKDETGIIKLSAQHSGGQVLITVEDDGKGINRNTIRETAIKKGLIKPDTQLTDDAVYALIFKSGFSTAEKVSQVSGRGVGMDVVRKEIDNLQGNVYITSEEGKNTKIVISLPLTLAIIDGLLIRVENDYYILPLPCVEACIDKNDTERKKESGREIIKYRDSILPFMSLRKILNYTNTPPEREQIVVVNSDNTKYGLVVDQVIGDYQTVIKNLGKVFSGLKYFSGATIMGDGRIALIINVNSFMKETEK